MMIELDDLSPEVLNLVVETLEKYEMYRLCIVISSRYKLVDRIGRYVS